MNRYMDSFQQRLFFIHFITKFRCCTTSIYTFTNSDKKTLRNRNIATFIKIIDKLSTVLLEEINYSVCILSMKLNICTVHIKKFLKIQF
jgi:hypothetical protein